MATERLEWLDLSPPPQPPKKTVSSRGEPPCPVCGWPIKPEETHCQHCGYTRDTSAETTDLLAELKIDLPTPLIEIDPAPASWFDGSALDDLALYDLRLRVEQMRVTTGFDRLICLDDINVEHYQHQLEAALRALRDMRGQVLLADEVGLGKTIEAGIIMKELSERRLVNTILIITPASLTWQWQEEMASKFHEEFTVLERLEQLPSLEEIATRSVSHCRWLISLDRAKMSHWAERLLAREYDLLLIDEAHKLKNHRTQAYRFVNQIRKRYVLMLTATPVHNDLLELYNLITILRPGHLGTRRAFRENFRKPPVSGEKTFFFKNTYAYQNYLSKSYAERQTYRDTPAGQEFIISRTEDIADLDKLKLKYPQTSARATIKELLAQNYEVAEFEAVSYKVGRVFGVKRTETDFICRLKLNPKLRKSAARNPAALRELLREVMIRNRRTSVGIRFPPRKAAVYTLNLTPPERELYDRVTTYIRQQLRQPTATSKLALMTLQKQLSSSPQAVARTLHKMVDKQPNNPTLVEQLVLAWGIKQGRKVAAVQQILAEYPGKFLIFTDYLPTLEALHETLTALGETVVLFHGGMSALERAEAVRAFRGAARVMISTRSGGEGHNLQFCHQLINYDLPWNPMQIEQRVGRLHRLGQKETVTIFNLAATDTIEAYILDLLAHKIRMFELVIGELDLILGDLGDNQSFEQHLEHAWASSYTETELVAMLAELEPAFRQSQQSYQEIREVSDELSDLVEAYDELERLKSPLDYVEKDGRQ